MYGLVSEKEITQWCDYCAITGYTITQNRVLNDIQTEITIAADDSHVISKASS